MIIDTHMHVFPYLGEASGWASAEEHVAFWETLIYGFARGKLEDDAKTPDINFRVGEMGRFEWTENGQDYYFQFMPPSMQYQAASPEFILAQMDHAGVDMVVLQNAKSYGKLNDYFSSAVKKYPDKFIGLLEIDELSADNENEISRLRHCVTELGLKGIYYEADRFYAPGCPDNFGDRKFDGFWREVGDLDLPVYWNLQGGRESADVNIHRMRDFAAWADRFPDIPSVMVLGFFVLPFRQSDGAVDFPKELFDIVKRPNVYQEIAYPIQVGPLGWDYPFAESRELIRQQYEELGAERLLWCSDMPNVERNCTYRQSLTYLKDYCDFISPTDMDLILGGNAARIHKLRSDMPKTPRPKRGAVA